MCIRDRAGTEATTDILFLQKREREIVPDEDNSPWISIEETEDGLPLNTYFVEHPEMVLGEMVFDESMFGNEKTTACHPIPGDDLNERLERAVSYLEGEYHEATSESVSYTHLSIFTVGGVVAGFVFASLYRITGKYAVPAGCLFAVVGMGLFAFVSSIPTMTIGVFLVGMAVQTVWPGTMNNYGKFVPISKMGLASSLFTSGMCLGCFLSSFFVNLVQGLSLIHI